MLNISEITATYIADTFFPEKQQVLFSALSRLESVGLKYYEDKLIEILQLQDSVDSTSKQDMFISTIDQLLISVINEHAITLNMEMSPTTYELSELVGFLFIVQNLDDYSLVSYRIYAEDTPRTIIVDIAEQLTMLDKPRLMELISTVKQELIYSLQQFISDKDDNTTEIIDSKYIKNIKLFKRFINNTECLGLRLYEDGYINLTLSELTSIVTKDISSIIDSNISTNLPQASLDCLSILMICKDSYELPILKFKQNVSLFTHSLDTITKLEFTMLKILGDFTLFKEASLEMEKVNGN